MLRNVLGTCKSEADRSESAIGVLRNALGTCKSEAGRSESAIGVLKTSPKPPAITRRAPRDIALRSPPIREAQSAIGVLGNALGTCKSEAERSESAIGVLKTSPKTLAITPAGSPQTPRDIALRSTPIREAESAIGVFRNALGKCKNEAERSESAIGVLRHAPGSCKIEAGRNESAIGVHRNALGMCKSEAERSERAIGVL